MLGSLAHYDAANTVGFEAMGELERLMLHRLTELDEEIRDAYERFDYKRVVARLSAFLDHGSLGVLFRHPQGCALLRAAVERKSAARRSRPSSRFFVASRSGSRRSWFSPPRRPGSRAIRARSRCISKACPTVPAHWRDDNLAAKWEKIRRIRAVVTGALEIERAQKRIGSSLEAAPRVFIADETWRALLDGVDFAEICITSDISIEPGEGPAEAFRLDDVPGVAVLPGLAEGRKCARSWKISKLVGSDPEFPDVTPRDAQALRELKAAGRWL